MKTEEWDLPLEKKLKLGEALAEKLRGLKEEVELEFGREEEAVRDRELNRQVREQQLTVAVAISLSLSLNSSNDDRL